MTRRQTMLAVVLLAAMLLLAGCGTSPSERVAFLQAQAETAKQVLAAVDAEMPKVTAAADQLRSVLADPAIDAALRDKATALLVAAEAKLAEYTAIAAKTTEQLAAVTEAIGKLQAGETITNWDELVLYGQIGQQVSTALPPPWNGFVLLASSIVTLVAGAIAGKQKQKADDAAKIESATRMTLQLGDEADKKQTVISELVKSVDELLNKLPFHELPGAKTTLKAKQSPQTRAAVMEVKANA